MHTATIKGTCTELGGLCACITRDSRIIPQLWTYAAALNGALGRKLIEGKPFLSSTWVPLVYHVLCGCLLRGHMVNGWWASLGPLASCMYDPCTCTPRPGPSMWLSTTCVCGCLRVHTIMTLFLPSYEQLVSMQASPNYCFLAQRRESSLAII